MATTYNLANPPSDAANASVGTEISNTSTFYLDVKCFLEGVQVPHSTVSVSYGVNAPPTCTLLIPAHKVIRDLPETTKIHVFFKDFLPTDAGKFEWRLLFDGELSSFSYSVDSDGAYMQINGIHSAAYMHMMQLMSLDVAEFIYDPIGTAVGKATTAIVLGQNQITSKIITQIIEGGKFNNMADIVFQLMRSVLEGTGNSATGQYYNDKLGDKEGSWKILKRIYGITDTAANSAPTKYSSSYRTSKVYTPNGETTAGISYSDYLATGDKTASTSTLYYDNSDWVKEADTAAKTEFRGMNASFVAKLNDTTTAYRAKYGMADSDYKFSFNSAFRSESYNSQINSGEGGARNSRHTTGMAVDVNTAGWSEAQIASLVTLAREQGLKTITSQEEGYGGDVTFVHLGLGG